MHVDLQRLQTMSWSLLGPPRVYLVFFCIRDSTLARVVLLYVTVLQTRKELWHVRKLFIIFWPDKSGILGVWYSGDSTVALVLEPYVCMPHDDD